MWTDRPTRLDAPNEWFFDSDSHRLYLWYNSSTPKTPPPASLEFVATSLKEMIGMRGTMNAPIRDVTIRGVGFRDAAATFMEPWGVPSGGTSIRLDVIADLGGWNRSASLFPSLA